MNKLQSKKYHVREISKEMYKSLKKSNIHSVRGHIPYKEEIAFFGKPMWMSFLCKSTGGEFFVIGCEEIWKDKEGVKNE